MLICEREVETVYHILWDCLLARDVWGASNKVFQKSNLQGPDFLSLAEQMVQKHGVEVFMNFVALVHRIWLPRNTFVH